MGKKVIIVGAGPGGLTTAMLLVKRGFDVSIYEKNPYVGGRNSSIKIDDYTFDAGPTFLVMMNVLEEIFKFTGRHLKECIKIKEIDPMYRLRFNGKVDLLPTGNFVEMDRQICELFPGDELGYEKFLKKEAHRYEKVFKCARLPYYKFIHYFRPQMLQAMPYLSLGRSLYGKLAGYFKHENMRTAMSFQTKYLGMSPWKCPAAFMIIPFAEHSTGVHHAVGGLNSISKAMEKVIEEDGGKIYLSNPVKELIIEREGEKKEKPAVKGIILENGERVGADHIVINADFAYAMSNIVDREYRIKYTDEKLAKMDYSCSTFMIYLGVDKVYPINHHNIIVSDNYKVYINEVTKKRILSSDPTIYIQNPSVSDSTLAPKGKSAIYISVPVPNNTSNINWNNEKHKYRDFIIRKIKEKTELKDIDSHIEVEKIITPYDWEKEYNIYNGAVYSFSHKSSQMFYYRPHNACEEFKNCYITGGGTHPGSGLASIYESGRIAANMIMLDGKIGFGYNYKDVF